MNSETVTIPTRRGLFPTIRGRLAGRSDSEHVQALVRIVIACIVWSYIFYFSATNRLLPGQNHALLIISIALVLAIGLFVAIVIWPQVSSVRRVTGMVIDFSFLSYLMNLMEDRGILFFAIYLWVTIGNGLRYGTRYLYTAMIMGIAGFTAIFLSSDYWKQQWGFSAGLLIAQIALPLYFSLLLNQINKQHDELKYLYEQMARHATHDSLTSLPNRKYFYDKLADAIATAGPEGRSFTVLYLDLDGFKTINDDLGHVAGDQLIERTARRIENCVRKADMVARVGGDEFVVILRDIAPTDAAKVAEKIIESLAEPFIIGGNALNVTTSIGIATYPQDGADVNTLIHSADSAMYEAKRNGKNGYRVYLAKNSPFVPASISSRSS